MFPQHEKNVNRVIPIKGGISPLLEEQILNIIKGVWVILQIECQIANKKLTVMNVKDKITRRQAVIENIS